MIALDTRPIQEATATVSETWWCVGREGVTRIEPYYENGQMAGVPWLAVFKGDDIAFRVNCAAVEYIVYAEEGDNEKVQH